MQQQLIEVLQQILAVLTDLSQRPLSLKVHSLPKDHQTSTPGIPDLAIDKLYSKQEVMAYMGISSSTYHRYKTEGIIEASRIGKRDFVTPEALRAALKESIRRGKI